MGRPAALLLENDRPGIIGIIGTMVLIVQKESKSHSASMARAGYTE